jgi:serine/threonine protein kinase
MLQPAHTAPPPDNNTHHTAPQGKHTSAIYSLIWRGRLPALPDAYSAGLQALYRSMMARDPNERPTAQALLQTDVLR